MTTPNTALPPRWERVLGARWLPWGAIGLALLLCAPAVGRHLVLDDYVLALIARNAAVLPEFARDRFDLFTFTTGARSDNLELMVRGLLLPWWTDPDLKIAFFRPISSLTHRVDFALFAGLPHAMYLHSFLWFAAVIAAVAAAYRRLESSPVLAGLATLLYAVDDARGPVVSWLSNRNALIATLLGVSALVLHDRARRDGSRAAAFVSAALLLAGLLAGEFALGALAYLLAYAAFLDPASVRSRALSLVPAALVIGGWRVVYSSAGFGAHGSGAYLDPAAEPLSFVLALPVRLLVLLHGQFGFPPSDLAFLGPPEHFGLFVAVSSLTVALVAFAAWPLLRDDRVARFWAAGAVLALVPVAASFSSDRLLGFSALGASALVARWVLVAASAIRNKAFTARALVATGFALLHGVAAPLGLPVRAGQMQLFGEATERATRVLDEIPDLSSKTVLVANAPLTIFASYVQLERPYHDRAAPKHFYLLATAGSPLELARTAERELAIRPDGGFLRTPLDRHYRASPAGLERGARVGLPGLDIEVADRTADGRPADVRFRVGSEEDYVLLVWEGERYVRRSFPAVGEVVTLPALDVGKILLATALGDP